MSDDEGSGGRREENKEVAEESRDWSELTSVCSANVFRRLTLEDRWMGAMLVCRAWLDTAHDPFSNPSTTSPPGGHQPSAVASTPCSISLPTAPPGHSGRYATAIAPTTPSPSPPRGHQNLQTLSIRSSQNVTDPSMFKVASCCPMLRELDISNCYEISYRSLEVIGQKCPHLTILKRNLLNWLDPLQHAGIVPDEYLRACPQDGDQEAEVIARLMPKLKHLELRFAKLCIRGLVSISEGRGD